MPLSPAQRTVAPLLIDSPLLQKHHLSRTSAGAHPFVPFLARSLPISGMKGQYSFHLPDGAYQSNTNRLFAHLSLCADRNPHTALDGLLHVPDNTFPCVQILVPTATGQRAALTLPSLMRHARRPGAQKPTSDPTAYQSWIGRTGIFALPHTNRDLLEPGSAWTGAPHEWADTPVLPVFRLPHDQDSAHQKLRDLALLAEDLRVLNRAIGPVYTFLPPRLATHLD